MCITQTLQKIEAEKRQYYTFIQTDKPIYKPGDTVRFRVVVVDRDLRPYHMNNININVTDSLNRPLKEFNDLGGDFLGVFTERFILDENTPLGIWKIRVIIDRIEQWETFKEFAVAKKTLPPFAVHIDVQANHLLTHSYLRFYAKYSFNEYVHGNAQLTITCTTNNDVVISETIDNVSGTHNVKYMAYSDLKADTKEKLSYKATVVFTEAGTRTRANKTIDFTVHGNNKPKIRANFPDKFMPGLPLGVKVFVYDWKDSLIEKTYEKVKAVIKYSIAHEKNATYYIDGAIKNGVAVINYLVPEKTIQLSVKVEYLEVTLEKNIEIGDVVVGVKNITLDYLPKNPNYGDVVTVHVLTDADVNQLIGIVMSRHGNIESHQVYCLYRLHCSFDITITKDMMPQAKVVVYYVNNMTSISQGEVTITTYELGRNTLDIDLPKTAKMKQRVDLNITTKPNSTAYILGYDERLTYLFEGNEIEKQDVIKELVNYDGNNIVTVFHIKKLSWHKCTNEELRRINTGRQLVVGHGGGQTTANTNDEEDEMNREMDSVRNPEMPTKPNSDDIREDFREVFIYDMFEVPNGNLIKSYYAPDSTTSWIISSFSMNVEDGLAIGPRKKLIVKSQFFIRMNLPFVIRFKEKLKVDVMIHNYLGINETLDVNVDMYDHDGHNRFKFFETACSTTASTVKKMTKTVGVPYDEPKIVSFYIQSGTNETYIYQEFKIRVDASATSSRGDTYSDGVLKKLKVEPVGIKIYSYENKKFNVKPSQVPHVDRMQKEVTKSDEYSRFFVNIAGDFMTDEMANVNWRFEINADHCLEQRTSRIKGNVEQFRYLKSKNANPLTTHFSSYYQSTMVERVNNWNYATSSGFRAYFIEAIASAMEIEAIPKNELIIEQELDLLKNRQNSNGFFNNFGSIPSSRNLYFQTAYILIPFLKLRRFVNKNYDEVITNGFNYLNNMTNISTSDTEAFSVAAYAYALNGNDKMAKQLLTYAEKNSRNVTNQNTCLTISKTNHKCDTRHTSYAVIAYVILNMPDKAKSHFRYIYDEYKMNQVLSNTYFYAVCAEAISRYLIAKPVKKSTDFTVTLTNEDNFKKIVHITKENQANEIEVAFPDYTLKADIKIQGSGFCLITKIVERTVVLDQSSSKFTMSILTQNGTRTNEKKLKVCAIYHPSEEDPSSFILTSVIYDVEMVSGYKFKELTNRLDIHEIKMVHPRLYGQRVQIYFDDFMSSKNYCVDIEVTKLFDIHDVQKAGVKIYDFYEKKNTAVAFYNFDNSC
ncbi:unnamed protein product [Chironomus riparius]|uniref:Uncharacterized protein n=1 Tax=Chironomus riparius TaxID=315576 RepID=A0A9N9S4L9_9DIPT|nr:unnamed protein product [Chironomus riparius]